MNKDDQGSLVLEKLAEVGLIDEFYSAIDSDNFSKIEEILTSIGVAEGEISSIISQVTDS